MSVSPVPARLGNWWLGETLGSGYSGSIYKATNVYNGEIVALKVQHVHHECPTNRYERHIYPSLQGGLGMPTLWSAGVEGAWDWLAIDLLGTSLDNLYRKSGKEVMDIRSVCCIAIQLISRLEFMHSRGILHRDIQLGNCVLGLPPNEKTIYMIDFGFSKRYIDPYTGRHIPDSKAKRDFIGNYWFSSVGVHCRGKVPSRRDDLEAAALMLIHLLTPRGLPWTRNGVPKTDAAHDRLKREKRNARPEDLCGGFPNEFEEFLRYCRRLKFQECPDYEMWKDEFRQLAIEEGFTSNDDFIWPPPPLKVAPRKSANTPRRGTEPPENMENVLNDLAKLKLDDRPILGDRKNVEHVINGANALAKKEPPKVEVIEILSDSDEGTSAGHVRQQAASPPLVLPKAQKLINLARLVPNVSNNSTLSDLVTDFIAALRSNSSRCLTKEGSAFLDALHKQLTCPSVFVVPLRNSRTRSGGSNVRATEENDRQVRLGVVARLRGEVGTARSNRALGKMVTSFSSVTNRASGRSITKDGFAFLEGLALRLKEIQ